MSEIEYARGIDVSEYQGIVDWDKVAASGILFAFIRASTGRGGGFEKDDHFDRNWEGARRAGILVGAYHYFGPGWEQAQKFVKAVGDRPLDLGYWLDVELVGLGSEKVRVGLEAIDGLTGQTCHVYTSKARWPGGVNVTGRKLWTAHYGVDSPAIPGAWKTWDFWQYSKTGRVPGISKAVDLDYYYSTPDKLFAEYGNPAPPQPPEPEIDIQAVVEEAYLARMHLDALLRHLGEDV